jgi:poly[(R)-3-hydroxyalkanoate] polymerase subunit PhaC
MAAKPSGESVPSEEAGEFAAAEAAGALDLLLSDAALGMLRRFRPDAATLRLAVRLARRPQVVARRARSLAAELGQVAAGKSAITASPRDRRFADPAWRDNPLLKRAVQAYLAAGQAAGALLADAELDWRDNERLSFLLTNLIAAAAPSNNPVISPAAWKALIDTGGLSAVRGIRALLSDMAAPPRVPTMVAPDAFEVGRDLAVSPGAVVARSEVFELIQYEPATEMVHRFPLLIVPPMINKFYLTDLAPGRSMIEYLVGQGHQVFVISWRNPDARHRDWDLDTYGGAVVDALGAVRRITKAAKASICALCSSGLISSMVTAHLTATGRSGELASLCLGVTVLDPARAGTPAALIDDSTAEAAILASARRGYLDGRSLAEVFAWLRPDDLIWNYWVNNYLQGQTPPPFDILYWNADTTRLPAALHRGFIELALANALTKPGSATMLGSPVDLSKVDTDSYVVAGITDHLCPWQSCYRSTQMLGGTVRFVLSTSGHIASMINPPTHGKATFRTAPRNPAQPRDWLAEAVTVQGSWWPDYSSWLAERSGGLKKRPVRLGSKEYPPMDQAPGIYVLDR